MRFATVGGLHDQLIFVTNLQLIDGIAHFVGTEAQEAAFLDHDISVVALRILNHPVDAADLFIVLLAIDAITFNVADLQAGQVTAVRGLVLSGLILLFVLLIRIAQLRFSLFSMLHIDIRFARTLDRHIGLSLFHIDVGILLLNSDIGRLLIDLHLSRLLIDIDVSSTFLDMHFWLLLSAVALLLYILILGKGAMSQTCAQCTYSDGNCCPFHAYTSSVALYPNKSPHHMVGDFLSLH